MEIHEGRADAPESGVELAVLPKINQADNLPSEQDVEDSPAQEDPKQKYYIVEPYIFLVCFAMAFRMVVASAFNMQKVCVNSFNHSYDFCLEINDTHPDYDDIQRMATDLTIASTVASAIPSVIMGVLIGSFCDKYGRKVPMMLAPVGSIIQLSGMLLCVLFFNTPAWWVIVCSFPSGLTGGLMVSVSAVYSYLTEVVTMKNRPMRFAILEMSFIVSFTSGTAAAGFTYRNMGFAPIYYVSIIINVLAIIQIYFAYDETNQITKNMSYGEIVRAVFSFQSVRASIHAVTRKRVGNSRSQILLLICAMGLALTPMGGTTNVNLYYVHKVYHWQPDTYAYLITVSKIVSSIATTIAIRLLTKQFRIHYLWVSLIGLVSSILEYTIRGFSSHHWELFVASYAAGCLGGCLMVGMRTYVSGHFGKDEIGKVFVLISIVEMNMPLLATIVFGWIFRSTLSFAIGTVYFVAVGLLGVIMIINLVVLIWGTPPTPQQNNERDRTVSSAAE